MEVKIIIIVLLLLLFTGAWIISNSEFAHKIIMSDKLFYGTNVVLLICSGLGLILTIILGDEILTTHLFEILLIPALAAFLLTAVSKNRKNSEDKYDEKQQSNMKEAAAFSWMILLIAMFITYAFYYAGNVTGLVFFPLLLNIAFVSYSASLIYFYKLG